MQKVKLGATIGETLRFVVEGWRGAWGAMMLLVWLAAALQAIQILKREWLFAPLLGALVLVFATTAATGALYRVRLSGDHPGDAGYAPGPAGFRWGGLEWRVLGANLLVGLLIGVILVVAFFIWAIVLGVSASANPAALQAFQNGTQAEKMTALYQLMLGPAGVGTAVILLPTFVGLLYLAVRLALVTPLAADTGQFDFGRSWAMTRGVVGAVLAGILVIYLVEFVVGAVTGFVIGLGATLTGHREAVQLWVGIVGQAVGAGINAPLFAGLQLYVYRAQRGDPNIAATFA
ncbi:MAG TPA: hypothetical protein VMT68_18190 [Caulobacteraceae bacterium]|nr:hypothetical protein [Caulobacteraceae bacterium]